MFLEQLRRAFRPFTGSAAKQNHNVGLYGAAINAQDPLWKVEGQGGGHSKECDQGQEDPPQWRFG